MKSQEKNKPKNNTSKQKIEEVTERAENSTLIIDSQNFYSEEQTLKILKERAKKLARPAIKKTEEEEIDIIEFTMSFENYGIESSFVREIYQLKEIVQIPGAPVFIYGITNIRGQIISIINLKKLFELPEHGISDMNKIIIIRNQKMEFGLLADSVVGMKKIAVKSMQKKLPTLNGIREKYLMGISADKTIVLDGNKLLSDNSMIVNDKTDTEI